MKKDRSRYMLILHFLAKMFIFCSLWLLFYRHPLIKNILYAMALFIGCEILCHCIGQLINKIKNKHNWRVQIVCYQTLHKFGERLNNRYRSLKCPFFIEYYCLIHSQKCGKLAFLAMSRFIIKFTFVIPIHFWFGRTFGRCNSPLLWWLFI